MAFVMKLTPLRTGGLFISSSFGGSVASASAPTASIKLTQSNCTAVSGVDPESYVETLIILLLPKIKYKTITS